MGRWITMEELAESIGSTVNTIKKRRSEGTLGIEGIKHGRSVRFDEDEVEQWKEWRRELSRIGEETLEVAKRMLLQPAGTTVEYKIGDRSFRATKIPSSAIG